MLTRQHTCLYAHPHTFLTHIHTHAHPHTCTSTSTHSLHTSTHMHIHTHAHPHPHIPYTHPHTCTSTHMHIHIHTFLTHIHTHAHPHTCTSTHMHIHTHARTTCQHQHTQLAQMGLMLATSPSAARAAAHEVRVVYQAPDEPPVMSIEQVIAAHVRVRTPTQVHTYTHTHTLTLACRHTSTLMSIRTHSKACSSKDNARTNFLTLSTIWHKLGPLAHAATAKMSDIAYGCQVLAHHGHTFVCFCKPTGTPHTART